MSWADDVAKAAEARRQGQNAQTNLGPVDQQTPFGGFFASALSGFTELFGQDPTPEAEQFRAANPIAGVVSQIAPTIIPYAGWAKATELPSLAGALERTVARTGLSAVERPIAYNAVKEIARFAPLEGARLGVGLATAPQENWGNLFADVGLSVALTGAGGSVLGMLKAGGKLAPEIGSVAGADIGLKPSFALRMGMEEGALATKGMALDEVNLKNFQEALAYKPGKATEYVAPLEGATPRADQEVQSLFRAQAENLGDNLPQIDKRTLELGKGPQDTRRLTQEQQDAVVAASGFRTIQELAATVDTPRLLTVRSQRAAGTLAKMLEDNDALQFVGDGTLLAREKDGGLFVFAKRVKSGEAEAGAKPIGANKIAEGDQWLIGKTDQPQKLVPEAHKVADAVISKWAKLAESYRPTRVDPFNASNDQMLEYLSPQDYRDLRYSNKREGVVSRISQKITQNITGRLDIQDSSNARRIAEGIADVVKPTMFKEASNPVYGRFNALLKDVTRVADAAVAERMPKTAELVNQLTDEEINLVGRAMQTQTPAEDLAKLSADGLVSEKATAAVKGLQDMNREFIEKYVTPGLRSAGMEGRFEALEGYIAPRVYSGDYFLEVKDEGGRLAYLVNAKNAGAAKAEAATVVEEAAARGKKWVADTEAGPRHSVEFGNDDIGLISDMVRERMGQDVEAHEIVQSAMRRIDAARAGAARPIGTKRAMGAFNQRTGLPGTPDRMAYTKEDLISGIEKHYRQLGRFVGVHAWRERWMPEVLGLEKLSPKLYEDLIRKTNQTLGVPGELTKVIDQSLSKVLGGTAGSKPATKIAQWTNSAMHAWTIGIVNPTFAVQNLLSVVQTVAPQIAYLTAMPEYGLAKMMQTMPRFGEDGLPRGTLSFLHPMKVMGQAMKLMRSDEPWVKEMYERAKLDGTIAAHRQDDWIGGYSKNAQTLKQTFQREGGFAFIKKASFFMADKSEEFSRMIAFNSALTLGKDAFRFEGEQLYRFARRFVETTMYSYGVVDRPRIMTGPIGSMFGLFKNWQFHFIGSMAEYAGVAVKDGVWGPMLWQGASALALGGLGATPLKMMADGLAKWESGDNSSTGYQWMRQHWQHDTADEVYFGLPAFLGVSLQNSSALPGTDVYRDTSSLMNIAVVTKAMQIGKAVGAAWSYGTNADENALANTQIRDAVATATLPRAFDKLYGALEGDYIRSSTGTPLERGISPTARMLTGLGVNSLEVERNAVAARELQADQDRTKAAVSALGQRYQDAVSNGDWQDAKATLDRAMTLGLPVSSVMSSAKTRLKREGADRFQKFSAGKVAGYELGE